MEGIVFDFFRGDTYERNFSIKGWNRDISKMYFTVKEKEEDKLPVLQKTLENGITLVDEEEGMKMYQLLICCTDTDKMKVNKDYCFDIEIHSETGKETIKKTIATGILKLKPSATRSCNEVSGNE